LLACGYRPKPRLVLRCLRVAHDAANYWSARITEPHIVVVLVPMVRTTAFACRYKNKLCVNLRMYHRWHSYYHAQAATPTRRRSDHRVALANNSMFVRDFEIAVRRIIKAARLASTRSAAVSCALYVYVG
jgi:hypothetical protein